GPYDYWAIEYAYKPIAPEREDAELQAIASRNAEPQLAYGTDEDNFLGIDPESLHFDLGNDPVAFARKRFDIARDLLRRQETRQLKPEQDYSVLRRSVGFALRDVARAAGILARQIGGVRTLRDFPGSGRDPLLPVSADVQRQALDLLASGVLSADSFVLSPALQRRMAPNYSERSAALFDGDGPVATDYSLANVVIEMQRALLSALMNDAVAQRLLDSESKAADGGTLRLSELLQRLSDEIWSELHERSGDIPSPRRELQREYVNRLAGLLLRPGALTRADARSLVRVQAQDLLGRIQAAAQRKGLSTEARAHLRDSADTLRQALNAPLVRQGA
ncbi:MAG TPA: zinc-dependent metalloprotease, partial [Burkholderiaceae bacterium]|nr:zinc-dependent metalloprotease [Burkholderiaceae bacterium]